MPPAAMMGRSTVSATSGSRTIVEAPRADLKPPPSTPSTTSAFDTGIGGLHRALERSDDVYDRHPGVVQAPGEQGRITRRGEDLEHARIGQPRRRSTGPSFQPWIIRFAATGLSVSSRTRRRSARPSAVRVSIMPRPPASDTARRELGRARCRSSAPGRSGTRRRAGTGVGWSRPRFWAYAALRPGASPVVAQQQDADDQHGGDECARVAGHPSPAVGGEHDAADGCRRCSNPGNRTGHTRRSPGLRASPIWH